MHLSPSGLRLWSQDKEAFILSQLRCREPQTRSQAAGSAFDCYVKHALGGIDFESLFDRSVELQNRDWAREHGKRIFELYDLRPLREILAKSDDVQFEQKLTRTIEGIDFLGKQDLSFKLYGW